MKDLKFYFWVSSVFIAFILGIFLGGKITFGAMKSLREKNVALVKYAALLEREIAKREIADQLFITLSTKKTGGDNDD